MTALRIVGGGDPYIDPRFLDTTDVPFILIAIIFLFIVHYKIKRKKKEKSKGEFAVELEEYFELQSYDVLMQHKKAIVTAHCHLLILLCQ